MLLITNTIPLHQFHLHSHDAFSTRFHHVFDTIPLMDPELKRRLADRAYQSVFSYLKEIYCDDAE